MKGERIFWFDIARLHTLKIDPRVLLEI